MNTGTTPDNAEPEKARELFEAAIRAEDAGDSDKALRLYERAPLIDPTASQPGIRLALLLYEVGKWKQAIRLRVNLRNADQSFLLHMSLSRGAMVNSVALENG